MGPHLIDGILSRDDLRSRVLGELAELGKDITARAFVAAVMTKSWRGISRELAALAAECLDDAWSEASLDAIDALWLCWAEGRSEMMMPTFEGICELCGREAAVRFRSAMAGRN